ncbi:MAG TPA: oligosaccharide flippase family protein [Nitrososphaeraceae archaeon]|jgi:O-antigen/teichoic acid export membrane protein
MANFSKQKVGKGAAYLYIDTIMGMVSGYIFWLVISRATGPGVVGVAAAVVSLATIITTIANLGIPVSIERFLGRTVANRKVEDTKIYVKASLYLLISSLFVCTLATLVFQKELNLLTKVNFDLGLVIVAIILTISLSINRLFTGIITSTLNTKSLAIASIASTIAKFLVAFFLLYIGTGAFGVAVSIASFTIIEIIILGLNIRTSIFGKNSDQKSDIRITKAFRMLITSGMPTFVPSIMAIMGSQVGTLLVFGLQGASHAGSFYIAYSIYTALYSGLSVIFSITFPVQSALDSSHQIFAWRVTKIGILATAPLSFAMMVYSNSIMGVFGKGYVQGATAMEILMLSTVPVALTYGISNLAYSHGAYRQVMIIGIVTSVPRTILYFILVPHFGEIGAALSFTAGSFAGVILSIAISKRYEMKIDWRDVFIISVIPFVLSYVLYVLHVNFVIGILITLLMSYIIFYKLRVLERNDVEDSLTLLPSRLSKPTRRFLDIMEKKWGLS